MLDASYYVSECEIDLTKSADELSFLYFPGHDLRSLGGIIRGVVSLLRGWFRSRESSFKTSTNEKQQWLKDDLHIENALRSDMI